MFSSYLLSCFFHMHDAKRLGSETVDAAFGLFLDLSSH
jgi:hypothetical protein